MEQLILKRTVAGESPAAMQTGSAGLSNSSMNILILMTLCWLYSHFMMNLRLKTRTGWINNLMTDFSPEVSPDRQMKRHWWLVFWSKKPESTLIRRNAAMDIGVSCSIIFGLLFTVLFFYTRFQVDFVSYTVFVFLVLSELDRVLPSSSFYWFVSIKFLRVLDFQNERSWQCFVKTAAHL